jgi:D-threo-aldose 1-dehydrogenase
LGRSEHFADVLTRFDQDALICRPGPSRVLHDCAPQDVTPEALSMCRETDRFDYTYDGIILSATAWPGSGRGGRMLFCGIDAGTHGAAGDESCASCSAKAAMTSAGAEDQIAAIGASVNAAGANACWAGAD